MSINIETVVQTAINFLPFPVALPNTTELFRTKIPEIREPNDERRNKDYEVNLIEKGTYENLVLSVPIFGSFIIAVTNFVEEIYDDTLPQAEAEVLEAVGLEVQYPEAEVHESRIQLVNPPNYSYIYSNIAITPEIWIDSGLDIPLSEIEFAKISLPGDIGSIMNAKCPIFPNKKIVETHILAYIPKGLTFSKLGAIARKRLSETALGFNYLAKPIEESLADITTEGRWVLMTKKLLPRSRQKSYEDQKALVEKVNEIGLNYKIPRALDAVACIYGYYFKFDKILFDPLSYTRCHDQVHHIPLVVGGFTPQGLTISYHNYSHNIDCGVAPLRDLT